MRDRSLKSVVLLSILVVLLLPATYESSVLAVEGEGRVGTFGVVNPAIRSPHDRWISLDGNWDFVTDPQMQGEQEEWFLPGTSLPDAFQIMVPGAWEAQGVGQEGWSQPLDYADRRVFEPIVVRLRNAYTGPAWYKKSVTIPQSWSDKQIWLKIGAVNAQGWIWVNGNYVAHNYVYCASYKYNITDLVTPGEVADVTILVRNDVNSRRGESQIARIYGGLTRSVELEATEEVFIDDAYVTGLLDEKQSQVHVVLRNILGTARSEDCELDVTVSTFSDNLPVGRAIKSVTLNADQMCQVTVAVDMISCVGWTPENPFLYRADIVLKRDGQVIDGWVERYGVREIEARDGDIYLNNKRFFMRGGGDSSIYPFTVCPPASREIHKQHLNMARKYGFNYLRHHTHCEIPEYYEAADEIGIMLQPELPFANGSHMSLGPVRLEEDLIELISHYRRYTSLMTYCSGSESNHGTGLSEQLYQLVQTMDPTRLFLHQDSGSSGGVNRPGNSDMDVRCIRQFHLPDGRTDFPQSEHEYMSFGLHKDPRLERKYTGAFLPIQTLSEAKAEVAELGIDWQWADACYDAGYRLQGVYHKIGIESARLDPFQDGFNAWMVLDVTPNSQNGVLDIFWQPKWSTPEYFAQFNAPVVILARSPNPQEGKTLSAFKDFEEPFDYGNTVGWMRPKPPGCGNETRVFAPGERLEIAWVVSNFGAEAIRQGRLKWALLSGEKRFAGGVIRDINVEQGEVPIVGKIAITMPDVQKPVKAKLEVSLTGVEVANAWDVWIVPKPQPMSGQGIAATSQVFDLLKKRYPGISLLGAPEAAEAQLVIGRSLRDGGMIEALEEGKDVIALSLPGFNPINPGIKLGWWGTTNQAGTVIVKHPAFGDYPHEGYLDQGWFRLVYKAERLEPGHHYALVEPLMIGSGREGGVGMVEVDNLIAYNLYTFQAKAGQGNLLSTGLNLWSEYPEACYLLDQFIRYAQSSTFDPEGSFDISLLTAQIEVRNKIRAKFNGWTATLEAPDGVDSYPSFLGQLPLRTVRQTDGKGTLRWRTNSWIPGKDEVVSFRWGANTGWVSQPDGGHFSLWLGERKLLDFDLTMETGTWTSDDGQVTLHYAVEGFADTSHEDSNGVMTLTLPEAILPKGGAGVELGVTGSASGSRRFFGIYEFP